MKKKLFSLLLVLAMVLGMFPASAMAAEGTGTADNPYLIYDEADLLSIRNDLRGSYILMADIAPETWTADLGKFTGTLDGNGYSITLPAGSTCSLLNGSSSGTVQNLILTAMDFTSSTGSTGILANGNFTGKIYNCAVIGSVNLSYASAGYAGGFVSRLGKNAVIENAFAAVKFTYTGEGDCQISSGAFTGSTGISNSAVGTLTSCFYNNTLCDKAIGVDLNAQESNCSGTAAEDCKTLAATLNTNRGDGIAWKDGSNYPTFASHNDVLTGTLSISGAATAGEPLTAEDTFDPANSNQKHYTWYRVYPATGEEHLLEDAAGSTYTPTAADVGTKIKVIASMENTIGSRSAITEHPVAPDAASISVVTFQPTPAAAKVTVTDAYGNTYGPGTSFELVKGNTYTYYVGLNGYVSQAESFTADDQTLDISLTQRTVSGYEFNNVADTRAGDLTQMTSFPTSNTSAYLKWATNCGKYGTEISSGEVTNCVYLDGYLYVVGGEQVNGKATLMLFKLDPATGTKVGKAVLSGSAGYYYFLSAGEGQIYVRESGLMEAFDTDLNKLWSTKDSRISSGMNYGGPVYYSDGLVFSGSAATGSASAGMVCLSADNGDVIWYNEAELTSSQTGNYFGLYWASPCAAGDYLLYGSDGGRVYAVNKYTGTIIDRLDVGNDMGYTGADVYKKPFIRSGVIYEDGKIYFTSTDGYVHMADFNAATGKISNHKYALIGTTAGSGGNSSAFSNPYGSTTTPAIHNGRLYAASFTGLAVFDADTLEKIYFNATPSGANPRGNLLNVVADSDGTCYIFTTYYSGRGTDWGDGTKMTGSIVMFTDKPGQTEPAASINFGSLTAEYTQYGCAYPMLGPDGTIYFANDLGTMMALSAMYAHLTELTPNIGSLDQDFAYTRTAYELVVPQGTPSVVFTLAATEGAAIAVNGTPVTTGTATVPLTDGKATAAITVTIDNNTVQYTLSIRESSSNTAISTATSTSNNISSNTVVGTLVQGMDNVYAFTNCTSSDRLWFGALDPNATMSKPQLSGYNASSATSTNTHGGVTYGWRFYFSNPSYPLLASTTVTAEDGVTTKDYYAAMFGKASAVLVHDANADGTFTPDADYLMAAEISETSHSFHAANDSITLTASAQYAGKAPEDTALVWASSAPEVATVNEDGKVTILKHGSAVISARNADGLGAECTVTLNTAPTLQDGVPDAVTADTTVGTAYTLDLTSIFTDPDGDALTYTVSVNGAEATAADASYRYIPAARGDVTLVFTASDGIAASPAYTVTLTVNAASGGNGGSAEPDSILVYASLSDATGTFVTGKRNTLLWNIPLTVYDENEDGKYTLHEAMLALHKAYHPDGKNAYNGNDSWIGTLWGDDSANFGLVVNNKWCMGASTTLKKNAQIAAFIFQDVDSGDYSDLYTYFDRTSYTAAVGKAKTFTVNGLNIMISYGSDNALGKPDGATVTVYDKSGRSVLTTETDENGQFTLTFPAAGTYTVEVSGTCDYTANGTYGGGDYTNAPVVPARCEVVVSGDSASSADDQHAADTVSALISKIGTVTKNSGSAIEAARAAYEKLTAAEKTLVSNYDILTAAEKAYAALTGKLPFTDTTESDYYYAAIQWAWNKGITNGVTGTTFAPNAGCTRSQMVTFLWRAAGQPKPASTTLPFTDVDENAHYYQALLWAIENGITNGMTATTFAPNATCTRAQMVAFLHRSVKRPAVTGQTAFRDVADSAYYHDAVIWAANQGITQGTSTGVFAPDAACTRGQMVTFLYRYLAQ